jgi:hypothetical protein
MRHAVLQANRPGAAMAVNPLVAQALQAAQWSANNGYATAALPGMHHAAAPQGMPQQGSHAGVAPQPGYPAPYAGYGSNSYPSVPGQPYEAIPAPPIIVRFPPNFDTNGGSYVFQAKSGCFLEPTTEFYYDPKHKRYYCAKDGNYYTHDASVDPPFKLFHPPAPSAESSQEADAAGAGDSSRVPSGVAANAAASSTSTTSKGKLTTTVNLGKAGAAVGFGLGVNKKAKLDIAKWGALQQADDEVEEDPRRKQKLVVHNAQGSSDDAKKHAAPVAASTVMPAAPVPTPVAAAVREETAVGLAPTATSQPVAPLRPPLPPGLGAPQGQSTAHAAPPQATHTDSSPRTSAPPPPPRPSAPAAPTAASAAPVCLLCQRQFPSLEMLQRHERESKLHADNLKKLSEGAQ